MSERFHLAIRADGGPGIGYGHLVRTGALAREFTGRGHRVTYLTKTPEHVEEVCPADVDVWGLGSDDRGEAVKWVEENPVDVVLTDSYEIGTDYQEALREVSPLLAVILDDTRFTVDCDVLINGNVYAPELKYEYRGKEPVELLGTEYLLMREEFRKNAAREFSIKEEPERALITMGGSGIGNATAVAIRAFDGFDVEVDVVLGPGFGNKSEVKEAAEMTDAEFNLLESPTDLPELMFRADLAVSACGSTVYELLASKTPVVGIPQAKNQEPIAEALGARGAIVPLTGCTSTEMASALDDIWSPKRRREIKEAGSCLVDGRGTERVYRRLVKVANQ